jgi:hypothetical protein
MVDTELELRLRRLLADSFAVVVLALVVLALVGGWLAYTTHVAPGTHVEERTIASYEMTGDFRHAATVTNGSVAFPEGQVLSNRSVYFTSVSPVLNGSFVYTYRAAAGDLEVNASSVLVLHAIDENDGNTIEYWRVTRDLGDDRTSLSPGETIEMSFSRDINATGALGQRIEERIGGSGGTVEALLTARVSYDGRIDGQPVSGSRTYRLPIEIDDGQYRVLDSGSVANASQVTEQVRVANEYGSLRAVGSVLLLVVSLVALVSLVAARQRGRLAVSEAERERLVHAAAHEEFDEWITTASLPEETLDAPRVAVDSLDGLVDLAIDTNRRVVEDPDRGGYFVLGEELLYTYAPSHRGAFEFERQ